MNEYQSLLIPSSSDKVDLKILFDACEEYMLNREVVERIILEAVATVRDWQKLAVKISISNGRLGFLVKYLIEGAAYSI